MGQIENRWRHGMTRREALLGLAGMFAGSPLLQAQQDPHPLRDHKRVPGFNEMLTAFDFEPVWNVSYEIAAVSGSAGVRACAEYLRARPLKVERFPRVGARRVVRAVMR